LIYHALARRNEECLILTSTKEPYACIGYAQDMRKELDLDYCKELDIGYFRRETGGGTVYLDEDQLFYQVIIRRDNPLTPKFTEVFFRRFLGPVVRVLQSYNLNARFVPINDLLVDDRKISGNGGGEIGNCKVLIGNLLFDFDFTRMASILKVPNESFRKRVYRSMKNNLTTLKSEFEEIPPIEEIRNKLVQEFEKLMGPLTPSELDDDVLNLMNELDEKMSTEEWLFQKVPKHQGRDIKVREGVNILHMNFKTNDWDIDMILEIEDDKIQDLEVVRTSNFNVQSQAIKTEILGNNFNEKDILNALSQLLKS
jgi:lipoate-protein ligase A